MLLSQSPLVCLGLGVLVHKMKQLKLMMVKIFPILMSDIFLSQCIDKGCVD